MFETLMTTIKSKVVGAEFRSATAARLQAAFNRLAQVQTNRSEFDSEEGERGTGNGSPGNGSPGNGERGMGNGGEAPKTIGDVFAAMMNQNRAAAGVRPVSGLDLSPARPAPAAGAAVGRNDPCPCGSGKKYKKCCGKGLA